MPILKSISIHTTVERSLSYILNPDKTEDLLYTNSVNCLPNAKDAYLMMKVVYEHFSSHKFDEPIPKQGKGRVKAIHYIQSFDPKDKISPEDAHKIGRTFARKAFGDNCQVVIATHTDKNHIHNHIIINAYGIDGQKFNDNLTTRKNLREISDRVCLAFGIKPIEPKQGSRGIEYNEWEHKQHGTSWKEKIRAEIDRLILKVKNVDELLAELEILSYTVKRGKYISIKAPNQQRAVRLKTLGEDYTVEQLASRVLWKDVGSGSRLLSASSEMSERYTATIYELDNSKNRHPDVYKLSAQLAIINRDNIRSIGELDGRVKQLEIEKQKSLREVNTMETKCNLLKSLAAQAEEYFSLVEKENLTAEEQLRAKMYKETLARQNIESRSDHEYLKGVIAETEQKAAPIREHYNKCAELLREYSDIADTYREISQGDYISKLIEQQRKQDAPQMRPRR
ncbi:MAG: relaxase/mobilization nuclease domain-containing protein [Lachnospiraceae bacterium]|nr:relaxase/mobilization nuclease domain-containing protein [Ruminococcus sp.]MCM1276905.1 relaxase/mobilization nuclease domain-containing protein [Lachnospiraceae bacterium]